MAVAYFHEYPEATPELAHQVADQINQQVGSTPPQGALYHAEGSLEGGGWWAFDVWEAEEAAERFYTETLTPVLQKLNGPEPRPRKLAVQWETSQPPPSS